jgi:hypothetical protein
LVPRVFLIKNNFFWHDQIVVCKRLKLLLISQSTIVLC